MVAWMGYERFFYELVDNTSNLEYLIEILSENYRTMQEIILESPGSYVLTGANFTTSVTSPPIFKKYFLPYFKDFHDRLCDRGKLAMAHVDGEIGGKAGGLIPLIREAGFIIADALAPKPATSITVMEVFNAWDNEILVWGGIPSLLFSPQTTESEFDSYVISLLKSIKPGDPFVLGIGDTVPIEANLTRVLRLSRLYKKYGSFGYV